MVKRECLPSAKTKTAEVILTDTEDDEDRHYMFYIADYVVT